MNAEINPEFIRKKELRVMQFEAAQSAMKELKEMGKVTERQYVQFLKQGIKEICEFNIGKFFGLV